jgi:DNA polymerase-3 subunit epsilon
MLFASPAWRDRTLWALDLETSGLSARDDSILSVGMVPVRRGRIAWGDKHYRLVRPPADHVPPTEALRVHHILPEEARRGASVEEALDEVLARLDGHALIVHYGKLDVGFLRTACRACGRKWPRPPVVDTVHLLSRLSHRLKTLDPYASSMPTDLARARKELGLPAHVRHHALYDALATAELFLALASRLELSTMRQIT